MVNPSLYDLIDLWLQDQNIGFRALRGGTVVLGRVECLKCPKSEYIVTPAVIYDNHVLIDPLNNTRLDAADPDMFKKLEDYLRTHYGCKWLNAGNARI